MRGKDDRSGRTSARNGRNHERTRPFASSTLWETVYPLVAERPPWASITPSCERISAGVSARRERLQMGWTVPLTCPACLPVSNWTLIKLIPHNQEIPDCWALAWGSGKKYRVYFVSVWMHWGPEGGLVRLGQGVFLSVHGYLPNRRIGVGGCAHFATRCTCAVVRDSRSRARACGSGNLGYCAAARGGSELIYLSDATRMIFRDCPEGSSKSLLSWESRAPSSYIRHRAPRSIW